VITHGTVFPLRYSPKSDVATWPVIGWIVALSRPVWVRRKSKKSFKRTLEDFVKTIKHGMHLIVYPEGTSSDGNSGVLPFKSAPFESAVTEDLPVFPILTRYREVPGRPTVCWYGDMTFLPHVWRVLGLPSIEAEVNLLPPVFPEGKSRKEMASYVHGLLDNEYKRIVKEGMGET
jgi:1-acyl-sn-glycerol-3-phosphate acyltransferase